MSPLMLGDNSSKSIRFHLEIQSNPNPTIAQSNPDRPTEIEYLQSTKFHRVHADNSGKWNKRELIEIWSNPRLGQDLEAYIKGLDQSWENNFNRQKFSGLIKEVAYTTDEIDYLLTIASNYFDLRKTSACLSDEPPFYENPTDRLTSFSIETKDGDIANISRYRAAEIEHLQSIHKTGNYIAMAFTPGGIAMGATRVMGLDEDSQLKAGAVFNGLVTLGSIRLISPSSLNDPSTQAWTEVRTTTPRNSLSLPAGAELQMPPRIHYTRSKLQHTFKHAGDFGITGSPNNKTLATLGSAIRKHVSAPNTQAIRGTYRGQAVTHFVDPSTGLNVIRDKSGNLLSGWKLSPKQLEHVTTTGKLGGAR